MFIELFKIRTNHSRKGREHLSKAMRRNRILPAIAFAAALFTALAAAAPAAAAQPEPWLQAGATATADARQTQQPTPTATEEAAETATRTTEATDEATDEATGAPTIRLDLPGLQAAGTPTATLTATLTSTVAITPPAPASPLATPTATATASPTPTVAPTVAPLEGTIIANRTELPVQFFVEGQTYSLDPRRSMGLSLPRVTAVANLFNCAADAADADAAEEECFWDPYLLNREGFYEIVVNQEAAGPANLVLQPAGSPPSDQIWIQNRTGNVETVVYSSEAYEIAPGGVTEFSVEDDERPIFFLRACVAAGSNRACEWTPVTTEPGFYYGMVAVESEAELPDSSVIALELEPVIGQGGELAVATATPAATPAVTAPAAAAPGAEAAEAQPTTAAGQPAPSGAVTCRLQVPVLNVRSGPGLEYEILVKISADPPPGTVLVTGRDSGGQWLAVDGQVAAGGWIFGSPDFVVCDGDTGALAVAAVTDGTLAATPTSEPVAEGETPGDEAAAEAPPAEGEGAPAEEAAPEGAPTAPPIPEGLAVLSVNNGFDHDVRFTIDQRFRPEIGPSEFDLAPGQATTVVVYPGQVSFSASSPWNALSGNAEFFIDANQARTLWLYFIPDPDGSGDWLLQY